MGRATAMGLAGSEDGNARVALRGMASTGGYSAGYRCHGPEDQRYARMTSKAFGDGGWIDRLAGALPALVKAQEPYLQGVVGDCIWARVGPLAGPSFMTSLRRSSACQAQPSG